MVKEYSLLEGQTIDISAKPIYEGNCCAALIEINKNLSDSNIVSRISSACVASDDDTLATFKFKGDVDATVIEGTLVYEYKGNNSLVEGVGIVKKDIKVTIDQAKLAIANPNMLKPLQSIPGDTVTMIILFTNDGSVISPTSPDLRVWAESNFVTVTVQSGTGRIVFKVDDNIDPMGVPVEPSNLIVDYFSTELVLPITFVPQPYLEFTDVTVSLGAGESWEFNIPGSLNGEPIQVTFVSATKSNYCDILANGDITNVKISSEDVITDLYYIVQYKDDNGFLWKYNVIVNLILETSQQALIGSLGDVEIIPADTNRIPLLITDKDGNPVDGVKLISLETSYDPKKKFILAGYSNNLNPKPDVGTGQYEMSFNTTEVAGTVTLVLTVSIEGQPGIYILPPMSFVTPGTPLLLTTDITTAPAVDGETTTVKLSLTQSLWLDHDAVASGSIQNAIATLPGRLSGSIIETDVKGTYNVNIVSNGNPGTVQVSGMYLRNNDSLNYVRIPFTFNFDYT